MKMQYAAGVFCACLLLPIIILAQDASNAIPKQSQQRDTAQQTDLIDIGKALFHIKPQKTRVQREKKIYFSILPVPGAVPGGAGRALITSTTAGTYLGPQNTTNLSSANFAPYWNFKGRFGIPLRTSIWLPNNTWNIQGDIRLLVYPQYTWGLGNTDNYQNKTLVNQNYIRLYQTALKKVTPYFYAGGGYNLDYHSSISSDEPGIDLQQFTRYNYGTQSSSLSSGVNLSLLYDTRNNSINPLPGSYLNIVYRTNPTFLGSDQKWNSLYIDARKYLPLNRDNPTRQNTIAFWSYFWTVFNSNAPYLDLPGIGSDPYNRSGEGLEQNRYRGRSLLYLESEYRRDITGNGLVGFVAFVNVTTVSGSGSFLRSWHPAAGTGLRIKFNKGSNTNIGIDYAFSKGYSAVLLNLGEKF